MDYAVLVAELPVEIRLALAYAPARARRRHAVLFALDQRLGRIVAGTREPMLAQLKLAWWREELGKAPAARTGGEPLLAALSDWGVEGAGLIGLVDGWEAMLGDSDGGAHPLASLAQARGAAFSVLAQALACNPAGVEQAGRGWALANQAGWNLAGEDLGTMELLLASHDWEPIKLPREMRPLQVLYGLARRVKGSGRLLTGPAAGMAAIRLGLFGR